MVENSQDCTAVVDDGELGNVVKGYSRESIDGSSPSDSNLSSCKDDSKMKENSQDCTAVVDNGELGNVVKGYSRESIDGSSVRWKSNMVRCRIWIIFLSVVFALSILCLGYFMGWFTGERRNSLNSTIIEINETLSPIADSPVLDPTNTVDFKTQTSPNASMPEVSPVTVPTPPPLSNSPVGSNLGSTTMPVNNIEPPTDPPIESTKSPVTTPSPTDAPIVSTVMPVNNIEPPTDPPIESTKAPVTTLSPTDAPIVSTVMPVNNIEPPTDPPIESTKAPVTTPSPTDARTDPLDKVTYKPGNLTRMQNKLLLSEGLEARIIAETGKRVKFDDGSSSNIEFHILPDAGAAFPDTRNWNSGGWIYVSNSEAKEANQGGVGAITFDRHGSVVQYDMVLKNTHVNCGGGRTPWNTWVSCEEVEFTGQIYQVDPTGQRDPERMTLGSAGGRWESFAFDIRDKSKPRFFATEDHKKGTVRRFTPTTTHWGGDEWKMLHEEGVIDYLFVNPNDERTGGTFEWTDNLNAAKNNARSFYPQSEGIDIHEGKMYVVCKKIQQLFIFDLDQMTYDNVSTVSGLFDGDPDQMQRILGKKGGLLYFTEEGGQDAGVHA